MDEMQMYVEMIKNTWAKIRQPVIFEEIDYEEIMLPAADGVKLRTMIWKPIEAAGKGGPYPVVFTRSCYPLSEPIVKINGEEYAKRGFCYIAQWCRGTGGSEGDWVPNDNERSDGLSTIEWISAQKFADVIGYQGDSYLAYTGWCMADAVPEKVKTMYLGVYGTDRYTSAYKDGLFRQDILTSWAMGNAGKEVTADYIESCEYRPQVEVDEKLWGIKLDWYRDWITNTSRNDSYWQSGLWEQLKSIPSKVKIPLYIKEGWYDHHLGSALVSYEDLSGDAKKHSKLQIGPWNHSFMPAVEKKSLEGLNESSIQEVMDWFEEILVKKSIPRGKVLKYVIGGNGWKETAAGEKEDIEVLKLYLNTVKAADSNGLDNKVLHIGSAAKETGLAGSLGYIYNPENPVRSFGAESCLQSMDIVGSKVQPPSDYREDVKSFISEPFEEGITINGKINVKLYVSSDAEDTAFTAKVMEVLPDGTALNIRGSITTLAYRDKSGSRIEYTPGSVEKIEIEMWDITWKMEKGSRLRLDISSSDFPQYAVHSNYKGIWSEIKETKPAAQTIYFGGEYSSAVEIPIERPSDGSLEV